MKYCTNCGQELADEMKFCANCGAPNAAIPAPAVSNASDAAEEQEFLNNTHRFLRYERTAWKVGAIVWFCITGFLVGLFSLLATIFGSIPALDYGEDVLFSGIFLLYALIYGLFFLPIAIVNLAVLKRMNLYLDPLYSDFRPAAKRCGEVGMIVLSAFFNEVALVFIIINFARMKSNRQLVDRIIQKQATYAQPQAETVNPQPQA